MDSAAIATKKLTLTKKPEGTGKLFITSGGGVVLDQLTFVKGGGGTDPDPGDTTPPTVTITGIEPAASIGDSKSVTPVWKAEDAGGLDTVTGTLDGKDITTGTEIPLWGLELGKHTVSVTATDKAGLKTTKTVEFTTVTSFADVKALITAFRKDAKVTKAGAVVLQAELETARILKNPQKKVTALKVFSASVTKAIVKDADVRAVLKRDAADLIKQAQK